MEQEELIKECRYYKGEMKNPYKTGNEAAFWNYEYWWVSAMINEHNRDVKPVFQHMMMEYEKGGLADFNKDDGVPTSLKSLLFSRYFHWRELSIEDAVDKFKEYYLKEYLK